MRRSTLAGLSVAATLTAVLIVLEPSSILSFVISILLITIISVWTGQSNAVEKALLAAAVIHSVSLALYAGQFITLPTFLGFSGGLGIGTDDHFFYTSGVVDLDEWFFTRRGYQSSPYMFSHLIKFVLSNYYTLFGYNHPLQAILLNNTGAALVPVFAAYLLERLQAPQNSQRLGFLLCLFGPYLLANGTILVRDGWVAAATIGGIAALLDKKWFLAALMVLIAYTMRMESALLIGVNALALLAILLNSRPTSAGREMAIYPARLVIFGGVALGLIVPLALNPEALIEFGAKAVLGRPDFVEGFIRGRAAAEGGTSTLLTIAQQPVPIRELAGFLFFLGAPFLAIGQIVVEGTFVPRGFLANLFSLVFITTLPLFVRATFSRKTWTNALWAAVVLIYLIDTLALAELSMQIRHKTTTIPFYYVIVALGLTNENRATMRLGLIAACGALGVNILVNYLNFL